MRYRTTLTLAFIFFFINHTDASDPAIRAVYGDGVHSYYAGNFQQSYDFLSRVVEFGTDDPTRVLLPWSQCTATWKSK